MSYSDNEVLISDESLKEKLNNFKANAQLVVIVWNRNPVPDERLILSKAVYRAPIKIIHCDNYENCTLQLSIMDRKGEIMQLFCTQETPHNLSSNFDMVRL